MDIEDRLLVWCGKIFLWKTVNCEVVRLHNTFNIIVVNFTLIGQFYSDFINWHSVMINEVLTLIIASLTENW